MLRLVHRWHRDRSYCHCSLWYSAGKRTQRHLTPQELVSRQISSFTHWQNETLKPDFKDAIKISLVLLHSEHWSKCGLSFISVIWQACLNILHVLSTVCQTLGTQQQTKQSPGLCEKKMWKQKHHGNTVSFKLGSNKAAISPAFS